jgi:hypothetical protein
MDEGHPVNRVGWFYEGCPDYENLMALFGAKADELLKEFRNTAVNFTPEDLGDEDDAASDPDSIEGPVTRLLLLMIQEAIANGACRINLPLLPDCVEVQFQFVDGQMKSLDSLPRRIAGTLFAKIRELAGERGEFALGEQMQVTVKELEATKGFTLSVARAA